MIRILLWLTLLAAAVVLLIAFWPAPYCAALAGAVALLAVFVDPVGP